VAAAGAGVDHWLPYRGIRSRFRGDRFHWARAHPDPVPGSTDFRTDGIHVGRPDGLRRVCLPARVLLSERIIVPGHISVGERVCIPVGAFIHVTDRIPEPFPDPFRVHIRDPVHPGLSEHIPVVTCVFTPACRHPDEHSTADYRATSHLIGASALDPPGRDIADDVLGDEAHGPFEVLARPCLVGPRSR
jgi:hypothetical protein